MPGDSLNEHPIDDSLSVGSDQTALAYSDSSEDHVGPFEDASVLQYDVSNRASVKVPGGEKRPARIVLIPLRSKP
jgi:hypothetical protein